MGGEKRNLETNLPKVLTRDPILRNNPVHLIGRFTTDRRKIRDKILDVSLLSAASNSIAKVPSTHESVLSSNNESRIE